MDTTNEQVLADSAKKDAVFLPDGWDESVDIFSQDFLSGKTEAADGSALDANVDVEATDESSEEMDDLNANEEDAMEADEPEDESELELATQEDVNVQPKKIAFSTTVDHKQVDVELDEDEIPALYQEAQGLKRTREKLNALMPTMDKAELVAEILGYKSVDDMLDDSKKFFISSEVENLMNQNVQKDVAEEIVRSKIERIENSVNKRPKKETPVEEPEESAEPTERDFKPEVAKLLNKFPSLKGKTLPQEVVDKAIRTGAELVDVYQEYRESARDAELEKLRKENKTLKQNAEAAKHAPVRGVANGGATDTAPDDPFLVGFNSYKR